VISIDTNVLVRLLVADDAQQARRARKLVGGNQVLVATTVLLETEWVLRSAYEFKRADIGLALRRFLGLPNVAPNEPAAVTAALNAYDSGLDFADALHLATVSKAEAFLTFDRRLVKAAKGSNFVVTAVPSTGGAP
jgi:predicted nucleic acid-binding protein